VVVVGVLVDVVYLDDVLATGRSPMKVDLPPAKNSRV